MHDEPVKHLVPNKNSLEIWTPKYHVHVGQTLQLRLLNWYQMWSGLHGASFKLFYCHLILWQWRSGSAFISDSYEFGNELPGNSHFGSLSNLRKLKTSWKMEMNISEDFLPSCSLLNIMCTFD